MIDKVKRNSLKRLGLTSAAVAAGSLAGGTQVLASALSDNASEVDADLPLADIEVHTRVSAATNDIEVVIRNKSQHSTRISNITPSETNTKRGSFDFSALTKDGDLTLAAGQSVSVPMTPHPVVLDASSHVTQRAQSLNNALRKSFSVVTENDAFARVHHVDGLRFV